MTELDPDQLLKSMDAAIIAARCKRSSSGGSNRNTIRMAGILMLLLGTALALFAMQYVATEFVGNHHAPTESTPQQPAPDDGK